MTSGTIGLKSIQYLITCNSGTKYQMQHHKELLETKQTSKFKQTLNLCLSMNRSVIIPVEKQESTKK